MVQCSLLLLVAWSFHWLLWRSSGVGSSSWIWKVSIFDQKRKRVFWVCTTKRLLIGQAFFIYLFSSFEMMFIISYIRTWSLISNPNGNRFHRDWHWVSQRLQAQVLRALHFLLLYYYYPKLFFRSFGNSFPDLVLCAGIFSMLFSLQVWLWCGRVLIHISHGSWQYTELLGKRFSSSQLSDCQISPFRRRL